MLQIIFKEYFQEFAGNYEQDYASTHGRFRLERITEVVENFISCGDYAKGVARIQCTNPECRNEFFRPFSYKLKRTELYSHISLGEISKGSGEMLASPR